MGGKPSSAKKANQSLQNGPCSGKRGRKHNIYSISKRANGEEKCQGSGPQTPERGSEGSAKPGWDLRGGSKGERRVVCLGNGGRSSARHGEREEGGTRPVAPRTGSLPQKGATRRKRGGEKMGREGREAPRAGGWIKKGSWLEQARGGRWW